MCGMGYTISKQLLQQWKKFIPPSLKGWDEDMCTGDQLRHFREQKTQWNETDFDISTNTDNHDDVNDDRIDAVTTAADPPPASSSSSSSPVHIYHSWIDQPMPQIWVHDKLTYQVSSTSLYIHINPNIIIYLGLIESIDRY